MFQMKQMLACTLSLSLLGQSALFAAPPQQPSKQPNTLVEYQQRAREEVKRSPWIQREGKYILGAGGAVVAGFVLQEVRHWRRLEVLQQEYTSRLESVYRAGKKAAQREFADVEKNLKTRLAQEEIYFDRLAAADKKKVSMLQEEMFAAQKEAEAAKRELAQVQASKKQLEKELRTANHKATGWQKSSEVQRGKLKAAQEAAVTREAELQQVIAQWEKRYALKNEHYIFLASYHPDNWGGKLHTYEKIFDPKVSQAERLALRNQLAQEPWLLQATQAQQKEFMKIVDRAAEMRMYNGRETTDMFMRSMIRMFVDKELPLYERLIGLCRHIFHSKNLMIVGTIFILGASAQSASAQKMADRVNQNFDLFLNATEQELAVMEKDKEVVKVCVQVSEVLHQMSQLTPEEQDMLSQAWRADGIQKPVRASRAQLAR